MHSSVPQLTNGDILRVLHVVCGREKDKVREKEKVREKNKVREKEKVRESFIFSERESE